MTSKKGFERRYSCFDIMRSIEVHAKNPQVTARPCTVHSVDSNIMLLTHGCLM